MVTTLAGSAGEASTNDGVGSAARFYFPAGMAVDGAMNLYVADQANYTIRKITPAGLVTTLAGSPGNYGSADGTGTAARFGIFGVYGTGGPYGVAVDSAGNVYVADTSNNTIRKVTPAGSVTTLAGSPGQYGSVDGFGGAARFAYPSGVAVDKAGNLYVADTYKSRITKGTPPQLQFDAATGNPSISNGSFQAHLIGPFDSSAVIEASTDLQTWIPIQTNSLPPTGLDLYVPLGTNLYRFFRARLAP